jgi:hypothetical protein
MQHCIVGLMPKKEATKKTCVLSQLPRTTRRLLTDPARKTARRPHLEELKGLLEEKRHIQREIDKTQEELERVTMATTQQLVACIESRVGALRK